MYHSHFCIIIYQRPYLDSIFKSRDITLPTKVRLVKAMIFPLVIARVQLQHPGNHPEGMSSVGGGWCSLWLEVRTNVYFKLQVFFYTLTKALGQRFDIFSFPHPDLLSPEIIVAIQSSCFSDSLRIGFTLYYLLLMCPILNLWLHCNSCYIPQFISYLSKSCPSILRSLSPKKASSYS